MKTFKQCMSCGMQDFTTNFTDLDAGRFLHEGCGQSFFVCPKCGHGKLIEKMSVFICEKCRVIARYK